MNDDGYYDDAHGDIILFCWWVHYRYTSCLLTMERGTWSQSNEVSVSRDLREGRSDTEIAESCDIFTKRDWLGWLVMSAVVHHKVQQGTASSHKRAGRDALHPQRGCGSFLPFYTLREFYAKDSTTRFRPAPNPQRRSPVTAHKKPRRDGRTPRRAIHEAEAGESLERRPASHQALPISPSS